MFVVSAWSSLQGSTLTDRKWEQSSRCHSQTNSSASYCHADDSRSFGSRRTAFISVSTAGFDLKWKLDYFSHFFRILWRFMCVVLAMTAEQLQKWLFWSVSPPLSSRLKYLSNCWMDCQKCWFRHWWFPDDKRWWLDPLIFHPVTLCSPCYNKNVISIVKYKMPISV